MDNRETKHKYKKYKSKYIKLKQLNEGYYLVHGTDSVHINKILEQGYIYSGRYLPDDETRLGGWEKLPYVYCNIYFDDVKNLPHSHGYTLILHPKIIKDKGIIFNKGWAVHPTKDSIFIKPNDENYDEKINLIKELVKNPTYLPKYDNKPNPLHPIMHHEVLIKDKIDVHKYLIGLLLPGLEGMSDNIQQILDKNGYKNIKIFTTSDLPNVKELI